MSLSDIVSLAELGRITLGLLVIGGVAWVLHGRRRRNRSGRGVS